MAITREGSSGIINTGGSGITATMPVNAAAGDLIAITVYNDSDVPTYPGTLTAGATALSGFGGDRMNMYYRVADGSETTSTTWSFTGAFTFWKCITDVWRGSSLSVTTGANGDDGATMQTSSITTAAGDALMVAFGTRSTVSSFASPLTARTGIGDDFAIADATPGATSAVYEGTVASFQEGVFGWFIVHESGGGGGAASLVLPQRFPAGLIGR